MPAIRGEKSKSKTRRRRRDLDQVVADLTDAHHLSQYKDSKASEDLPSMGEFYCIECAKWFESETNLKSHCRAKPHKRRLRQLKDGPYTQKEAEAAVGLATDNGRAAKAESMAIDTDVEVIQPIEPEPAKEYNDDEEYDAFFAAY